VRRALPLAIAVVLLSGCHSHTITRGPSRSPSATGSASPSSTATAGCDTRFEKFTYHSARLHRLAACVTATGTVVKVKVEADGDDHIQVRLDPQWQYLMNAANRDVNNPITRGYFIVEPDCVGGPVVQADAKAACAGAVPPPGFLLLRAGAHVAITGPWVLDAEHGHNEIHPVERVVEVRAHG
jgi:hypothetical protein